MRRIPKADEGHRMIAEVHTFQRERFPDLGRGGIGVGMPGAIGPATRPPTVRSATTWSPRLRCCGGTSVL
eukprot:1570109-Pyramimonas_sp.AAC.1